MIIFTSGMLTAHAADVPLKWDPAQGATGYKIYLSQDQGVTWSTPLDVGNVTAFTYTGAPEDKLLLFRSSAYNEGGEAVRTWSGAWYDHRKKPLTPPTGQGIN